MKRDMPDFTRVEFYSTSNGERRKLGEIEAAHKVNEILGRRERFSDEMIRKLKPNAICGRCQKHVVDCRCLESKRGVQPQEVTTDADSTKDSETTK
jgi:hypothetical protein